MSYDQKQAAAVLTKCSVCEVEVYATNPRDPYICVICRDQPWAAGREQGQS